MDMDGETLSDIARELGMHERSLYVYRGRYEDFPQPTARVGRFAIYDAEAVAAWLEQRGGSES